MARLRPTVGTQERDSFQRLFAHRPNLQEEFRRFYATMWSHSLIDPTIKELCRLKAAQIHGCAYDSNIRFSVAVERGLTEGKIVKIADYENSDLEPREVAALRFCELFCLEPHAVYDELVEELNRYFSPPEIADLTVAIGIADSLCRLHVLLGVEPNSPEVTVVPTPA
ncbi:MAG: carboxymuconolactone decarboxylase family protein [Chloroflexi bacterium]|nr:carboxymuconolactone decarboxylase family protein [Chloroflexota bacterium]